MADDQAGAQAVELVRALCDQLHKMTRELAWRERQDVTGRNGRAWVRREVATLRLVISEAQFLIDRLERRYLNGSGQARLPEQPRRSVARSRSGEPDRRSPRLNS